MGQRDDGSQVLAEISRRKNPDHDPKSGSNRVEQRETPPGHSEHSGQDSIELTQQAEEPRKQHRGGAVADIRLFNSAKAFVRQPDLSAESQHSRSSDLSTDQITQIIACDRAYPGKRKKRGQRHLAATG